jgi:hypothetical protein
MHLSHADSGRNGRNGPGAPSPRRRRRIAVGALAGALVAVGATPPADAATAAHPAAPRRTAGSFIPGATPPAPPTRPSRPAMETSTNWAGYAVTGGTYTSVGSSWVEPKVACTSTGIVAFWVGLDGWGSGSVEQDGTGVDCTSGSPSYFAWWETYPQDPMEDYTDPVAPGDVFDSTVSYLGAGQYELDLTDVSKGWAEHHKVLSPGTLNASAEIVAEAVTEGVSISAVPDFGAVRFTGSQIDKAPPSAAGVQPIDMTTLTGTTLASTGPLDPAGDFTVAYQDAPSLLAVGGGTGHRTSSRTGHRTSSQVRPGILP